MKKEKAIMAIDIGGGTQDILLLHPGQPLENATKLVVPSPTVIAARRIHRATMDRTPVFLTGRVMGGGAVSKALQDHIKAGLGVYSMPGPALTFHDNSEKVQRMGIRLVTEKPDEHCREIVLGDLDFESLEKALALFEVAPPDALALALQDHGFSPNASNRLTRFAQWQKFLNAGGEISSLLYTEPPAELTRWRAAAEAAPGAFFMDTSAAALRGAILDETGRSYLSEGLTVVNVGNEHTVAFLIRERQVWGVFEHHTSLLTSELLAGHLEKFRQGNLAHQEIFDQWGHGVGYNPDYKELTPFKKTVITGPRRLLAQGLGHMAAPFGEMMLSGCFGLVEAVRETAMPTG